MSKLKLLKYILMCPSDIHSMIQSLQTGKSKNIVDPDQTAPKGEGSLIDYSKAICFIFLV